MRADCIVSHQLDVRVSCEMLRISPPKRNRSHSLHSCCADIRKGVSFLVQDFAPSFCKANYLVSSRSLGLWGCFFIYFGVVLFVILRVLHSQDISAKCLRQVSNSSAAHAEENKPHHCIQLSSRHLLCRIVTSE